MSPVFKVMIQCPDTRRPLETGVRTSSREALLSSLYENQVAACPHCHQFHTWQQKDIVLELMDEADHGTLWRPNPGSKKGT